MAVQTVLKNVCSFVEILAASRSPQVALWDATSLRNALEWAAYCQQVLFFLEELIFSQDFYSLVLVFVI